MRTTIQELLDSADPSADEVTVYHEQDDTLSTVTAESFIGEIYELAGLRNIAASIGAAASGFVQISSGQVVDANPDWIFLAYPSDTAIADLAAPPAGTRSPRSRTTRSWPWIPTSRHGGDRVRSTSWRPSSKPRRPDTAGAGLGATPTRWAGCSALRWLCSTAAASR